LPYIAIQSSRFRLPSFQCLCKRPTGPTNTLFIGTIAGAQHRKVAICEAEAQADVTHCCWLGSITAPMTSRRDEFSPMTKDILSNYPFLIEIREAGLDAVGNIHNVSTDASCRTSAVSATDDDILVSRH
jgi:hypothetical protein